MTGERPSVLSQQGAEAHHRAHEWLDDGLSLEPTGVLNGFAQSLLDLDIIISPGNRGHTVGGTVKERLSDCSLAHVQNCPATRKPCLWTPDARRLWVEQAGLVVKSRVQM